MKIKPIVLALVFGAATAATAIAQPAGGARPQINPATLTEAQIVQMEVPAALLRLGAIYKQSGDWQRLGWTLQRLIVLQPNNGDLKLALATTYAMQGDKTQSYDVLLSMHKQGFGIADLAKNPNFAKVADTKAWSYVVENLASNLKPSGEGKVAFTLPGGDKLFESLAFDPKRKQLLVGSVREGKVYLVDKDGKLQDFITPDAQNGLWSVYAMAADPDADALYVASTASVYFKGFDKADFGKAGVFKFRLSSGKLLDKYLLSPDNQPRTLSSIAVGKGGLVFAADGLRNIIYRLDGGALKPMLENPRLNSIRGMTVSGDGKTLYFADYSMGVFGVDLSAGKAFDLDYNAALLTLGGIDGLYWYDGTLVLIQNGMNPRRVIRLSLADNGRKVVKVMPLDVANPAFTLPTYGAIDGDGLYFVANSQKNEYDAYGSPNDASKLEPVRIFRSNLRFAWDQSGGTSARSVPQPLSTFKQGGGKFGNVDGGSQSVSGN